MGFKYNRRIKICKGLTLNVGKKGISTSVKVGKVTYNSKGRLSVKTGIKGLSYSTNLKSDKNKQVVAESKKTFEEKCNDFNNKVENFNTKVNATNEKMAKVGQNKVNENIEQWESIGNKLPFLKGLCNFMIKINKKQLKDK